MNHIEKIKFGMTEFDLVVGGMDLTNTGGKITFQVGNKSFEEIKNIVKENAEITKIGLSGKVDWVRSDLVYAGKLSSIENYTILEEDGITEKTAEVAIAEFKLPDLLERINILEKENAAMKESLGALLLTELEEK